MQLERVRYQRAYEVALGITGALSGGELERPWFEAMSLLDESEVDPLAERVNVAREVAHIKAQRGF